MKNSNKCKTIFGRENESSNCIDIFFLFRNICPFLNLCSVMLASCLCDIQRDTLKQFDSTSVIFLTKLHLSDFDNNRMLRYLPSWDDYQESFQTILQQSQRILDEQWKDILELNTCLNDAEKFGEIIRQEGYKNRQRFYFDSILKL